MLKRILLILINIFFVSGIFLFANCCLSAPSSAKWQFTQGLQNSANKMGYSSLQGASSDFVFGYAGKVLHFYVIAFTGILFLVLMIWGGYLWMTAKGNTEQLDKARTVITDTIIGLIIILAAYAITIYINEILVSKVVSG
jgi:hypothetical protein